MSFSASGQGHRSHISQHIIPLYRVPPSKKKQVHFPSRKSLEWSWLIESDLDEEFLKISDVFWQCVKKIVQELCLWVCGNMNPPPSFFMYGFSKSLVWWYKTTSSTAAKLGKPCWKVLIQRFPCAQKNMRHVRGGVFPSKNALHDSISYFFKQVKWQCRQKRFTSFINIWKVFHHCHWNVWSFPGGVGWLIFFGLKN